MSLRRRAVFVFRSAPLLIVVIVGLCVPLYSTAADTAPESPPLYEFIKSHIDPATGALSADATLLPDEPGARRFSRLRWVPGALEGLGTRHMHWDGSENASRATRLLELIEDGNDAAEPGLYDLLRTDDVVTFYSDTLDLASARIRDPEPVLHDLARRLVTQSRDRGPVKFGIAMLGAIGDPHDLPLVQRMALHDEFGLYAAEAIGEIAPDPQGALFDMARKVTGWGRVEAVTKMVATSDPALRRWLLTEGFRNTITPQYLAYQCVTIAKLADALADALASSHAGSKADLPLLVGAADLIQTLIKPGPGPGIDRYSDAAPAAESFLHLIQKRHDSVSFFLAADALRDYATAYKASADDEAKWTPEQQHEVADLASRIAADSSWKRHVTAAILNDNTDLNAAETAAQKLKIETFELHVKRLEKNPSNPTRWTLAFASADPARAARLVDIAQHTFGNRFSEIDPRINTTDSNERRAADTLEAVLKGVAGYPGSGLRLVESSLGDGDDRVRRAAVETLIRWGGPYLRDPSVRTALNTAARGEADEALKARMVALLNLGTLP